MEDFGLLSPIMLVMTGLTLGAILKSVLKRSGFPYTVALFVLGLVVGLVNRSGFWDRYPLFTSSIDSVADMDPDFILYIFLPILIFDAAYELNMHIFRKTLANATLLAGPGLVVCMMLTGCLIMAIAAVVPGFETWNWSFALMFGALISATDPVAVIALLQELRTSKRFSTLVDAESLLNDGTGIVCFMLFFGTYASGTHSTLSPFLQLLIVVGLSVVLGSLIARLVIWFITRINSEEMVQNSVIILAAYFVFILSQYYLGVSGVISLVAFGLIISNVGRPRLKPQVNVFMERFWNLLTFMANTLIFIIVGVVIAEKVSFTWQNLGILFLIYVALNLIRFMMILVLYPFMKRMGYGLSKGESLILSWGGLRGALAMTLALMVSYTPSIPEEIRRQILFFTAGIVTLTLSINATTMRWLLKRLGLINISFARTQMDYKLKTLLRDDAEKYFESLQEREALEGSDWEVVKHYIPEVPEAPQQRLKTNAFLADIRLRVLDREKSESHLIYEDGIICKTSFLKLTNSLNELYDHDGTYPLNQRDSLFNYCNFSFAIHYMKYVPFIHDWISFHFRERIMVVYDLARGFIILQKKDLKLLDELLHTELVATDQKESISILKQEIYDNIERMDEFLLKLAQNFPKVYKYALTHKSIRMLLSNERGTILDLQDQGVVSAEEVEVLLEKLQEKSDELNSFSHTVFGTLLRWRKIKK